MDASSPRTFVVAAQEHGQRLDRFLAIRLTDYSRTLLRKAIGAGAARINDHGAKPSTIVNAGDQIVLTLPDLPKTGPVPEPIPLNIIFEDPHLVVVNKPPGMVVHPARGHWSGTLASALAFHCEQLSTVGGPARPGIVHRLDRDTTGVIVVAKTDMAHSKLAEQFAKRTVEKEYVALVHGAPKFDSDHIDRHIAPHRAHREKMMIASEDHPFARHARTFYQVLERLGPFTFLKAKPVTGRTHQIRVHLTSIGCMVVCDKLYGGRPEMSASEFVRLPPGTPDKVMLNHQALHAARLTIKHPITGESLTFEAPLPEDYAAVLDLLRGSAG